MFASRSEAHKERNTIVLQSIFFPAAALARGVARFDRVEVVAGAEAQPALQALGAGLDALEVVAAFARREEREAHFGGRTACGPGGAAQRRVRRLLGAVRERLAGLDASRLARELAAPRDHAVAAVVVPPDAAVAVPEPQAMLHVAPA